MNILTEYKRYNNILSCETILLDKGEMNTKTGLPKISFALALFGLSFLTPSKASMYVLGAIFVILGIIQIFKNISSKPLWQNIVSLVEDLDITYYAFGLVMINFGRQFLTVSFNWQGMVLLVSGVIFAGYNIGTIIGKGGRKLLDLNLISVIVVGSVIFILGLGWAIIRWNNLDTDSILLSLNNIGQQIVIVCTGIILIYFGAIRLHSINRSELQ